MRTLAAALLLTTLVTSCEPSADPAPAPSPPLSPSASAPVVNGSGIYAGATGDRTTIGTGQLPVSIRVESETGISSEELAGWPAERFAAEVTDVLSHPQGWTRAAQAPITAPEHGLSVASWTFHLVGTAAYDVRLQLASPETFSSRCRTFGIEPEDRPVCTLGDTTVINLQAWQHGMAGYGTPAQFRAYLINHQIGHVLGFDHVACDDTGRPAPVMAEQLRRGNGCVPHPYPYAATGELITGPWREGPLT